MNTFKKNALAIASCLSLSVSVQCFASSELVTDVEKESYSIGASFGHYISSQLYGQTQLGAEIDVDIVVEGVLDAMKDESKLTDEDIVTYLNQRAELLNLAREAEVAKVAAANLAAGQKYLSDNRNNDDVTVTDSGLQYEVITMGDGEIPKDNDVVTVHYKGYLVDGTEFDNSYKRDEPNRFSLITVIEGWQEGLKLMPIGSTFKLTIPAKLAYGERTVGPVAPNSTLIFEVELVKVEAPGENSHGMGLSGMGMGGMMGSNPHQ
ncbi:FKBP-type peptidyl-prolyl cis-trans isomerase [Shewanella eurypsychrophilus]|uniref:Peptidyl-prolyl cis-trans isomerase n=1 Tax=Shewanella eurypsychrophilus TaxID=2593656 RepID=A0ABX6VB38_9GAMM|nr:MULTISPECIES: FKBP-type peptidyl-prolyl cis-trans isomerase [Shewanella]QFU24696.1 peptidylprolyl isomerase [Shewanella sp. YLB-09]QPG59888.1 FKBP-type peptidyl-prolyl cis-trans isomerase [Shewanella eurypsychrophilus]